MNTFMNKGTKIVCQKWDLNPCLLSKTRILYNRDHPASYRLESGALDRSAILTYLSFQNRVHGSAHTWSIDPTRTYLAGYERKVISISLSDFYLRVEQLSCYMVCYINCMYYLLQNGSMKMDTHLRSFAFKLFKIVFDFKNLRTLVLSISREYMKLKTNKNHGIRIFTRFKCYCEFKYVRTSVRKTN